MRKLFSLVALFALALGLVPSSGTVQAQAGGPEYGAAAFMLGHPETTDIQLQRMTEAGLSWVRVDIPWRSIEASCQDCFDWTDLDRVVAATNATGIRIMASVHRSPAWSRQVPVENGPPDAMSDYADFLRAVAERYYAGSPFGTIHAIQVWNEPNLSREWGNAVIDREQASQYMYMLKESYKAIKAVDPSKTVVSAGLSPTGTNDGTAQPDDVYLSWLYDSGLAQYSDAIGMHAPGFGSPPEAEPLSNPAFPHPSFYFRRIEQLRDIMVLNGDAGKRAWINEFGWTTDQVNPQYSWYAVTPEQQAEYIVRAYRYAATNWSGWVGPMFVWNIADPTWTPEYEHYWWSITEPDGTPRPAYLALQAARTDGTLP
ncbi:MAG: cellulase family glycosylhydrolase [Chloroflexota bacterium]|nr:cellulase family glycosylhydrolase [Chloroflexota bacterium]